MEDFYVKIFNFFIFYVIMLIFEIYFVSKNNYKFKISELLERISKRVYIVVESVIVFRLWDMR